MPYVTLKNKVEIYIDMEEVEPVYDERGMSPNRLPEDSYPPELCNEDEMEQAVKDAEYFLWDEDMLQLPATHRYSVEAIDTWVSER